MEMMDYMPYSSYIHTEENSFSSFLSYEEEKKRNEKQKKEMIKSPLTLKEKIKNKL